MLKKILKDDYIYALFTRVLCIILGFAYTILLSRYLGASLRGEYSIVLNYATIISVLIGFGIYQSYPFFKRKLDSREEQSKLYKNIVSNILALFVVYFVVFLGIALLIPMNLRLRITLIILPTAYLYKQLNYITLIEHPRACNRRDVLLAAIDVIIVIILMISTKANITLCFAFLIIDKLIYALLPIKDLGLNVVENPPKITREIKKYISYGFVPMLTLILMTFNHKVDIVMLSFFKNVTTSEVGIYSLGVMLAEKIWMLPDTLTNILQAKLAGGKKEDEVSKISRISFSITALCLIMVVIFGKPLIIFAYGAEYAGAYQITLIILLGVLGMVFYKVVYAYNVVIGKSKLNFILLLSSVIINIILNLIMISKFGVIGAGYASLIAFIACGGAFLISFSHDTKIKITDMIILKREDIKLIKILLKEKNKKEVIM